MLPDEDPELGSNPLLIGAIFRTQMTYNPDNPNEQSQSPTHRGPYSDRGGHEAKSLCVLVAIPY